MNVDKFRVHLTAKWEVNSRAPDAPTRLVTVYLVYYFGNILRMDVGEIFEICRAVCLYLFFCQFFSQSYSERQMFPASGRL